MAFKKLFDQGEHLFKTRDWDNAVAVFSQALKIAIEEGNNERAIECNLFLFKICHSKNGLQQCKKYIADALSFYSKDMNEVLYAKILNNKGLLYKNIAEYEEGTNALLKAAEIFERTDDQGSLAISYSTLGSIYIKIKNYSQSADYHLKALKIRTDLKDDSGVAKSKNNLANTYLAWGKLPEAEQFIRQSIDIKARLNVPSIELTGSYSILGGTLELQGKYQEALEFYQDALKIRQLNKDIKGILGSYIDIGRLLRKKKELSEGIKILKKGLNFSRKTHFNSNTLAFLLELYISYKKQKKYKKALKCYEKYDKEYQKLFAKELMLSITEKQIEFEVNQKDRVIERMETNIREFHHRVKNNFQFISSILNNKYHQMKDGKMKGLIRETEGRIQAMMYVHRHLFNKENSTHINIKEYIENLVNNLILSYDYSDEDIDLQLNVSNKEINAHKAIQLGLVVNELVSNSFKYAFPGHKNPKLQVKLIVKQNQTIRLMVGDNGAGFNLKDRRPDAFGVNLIKTMCKQLNGKGTFSFESGTKYQLLT